MFGAAHDRAPEPLLRYVDRLNRGICNFPPDSQTFEDEAAAVGNSDRAVRRTDVAGNPDDGNGALGKSQSNSAAHRPAPGDYYVNLWKFNHGRRALRYPEPIWVRRPSTLRIRKA